MTIEPLSAQAAPRDLADRIGHLDGQDLLRAAADLFGRDLALVSSFGTESAIVLHMASLIDAGLPVVFLDTGKLFGETQRHRRDLTALLGLTDVRIVAPDAEEERREDPDGLLWRSRPESCCALRKVRPLAKALAPFRAWVTGRKRYHGGERQSLASVEIIDGKVKLNPLAGWSRDRVESYLDAHDLPRHPLEEDGFLSVGCMPCTDRVLAGEGLRDGRWRGLGKTECGIHLPLANAVKF